MIDCELSLLKKLTPQIHEEILVNVVKTRDKMAFPVSYRTFSSISAMSARRNVLRFDFDFITKELLKLYTILVVKHLELWDMTQALEKRVCRAVSRNKVRALATF
jgi:hypothetical protein